MCGDCVAEWTHKNGYPVLAGAGSPSHSVFVCKLCGCGFSGIGISTVNLCELCSEIEVELFSAESNKQAIQEWRRDA
jgi:hypothetical protein